jgi:murein DD-endopeptidase MepM/ murein hydrolase activator NlpD
MIKFFLRKSLFSSMLFLAFIVSCSCLSFLFVKAKICDIPASEVANPGSAGSPSLLFKAGSCFFRVARAPSCSQENTPLLWRGLLPSDRILTLWETTAEAAGSQLQPLVAAAGLTPLSPEEAESFRREINLQSDMARLSQILAARPGHPLGADHDLSLLADDLDLRTLPKPTGKLMLNPQYPRYCFPVSWPFFFRNSFGDPRAGGRLHIGIDIFAEEGTPVYAMTDGVIQQLADWPNAGNTLLLAGQDGRGYIYMHLQKYAENVTAGKAVKKGDIIAYVGHTGTISSPPHLHFQVHADQSFSKTCAVNPYEALASLSQGHGVTDLGQPQPHFSMARGPDQLPFASKMPLRKEYFQVVKGVTVKTALIKSWDVKKASPQEPGLVWRVPDPTWKVPRGDLRVPDEKAEASSSSTRVTWTWPKPRTSTQLNFPADH